jgi:SPP1 family predicted phage head-tail adaptor
MSLLTDQFEDFTILDKRTVPDGYGGYIETYVDGARIEAAVNLMSAVEKIAAAQIQPMSIYHIITRKNINLQDHDVVRRESDGKIFRVTGDGDDNKTPNSAGLNMRVVNAEEWSIPS